MQEKPLEQRKEMKVSKITSTPKCESFPCSNSFEDLLYIIESM